MTTSTPLVRVPGGWPDDTPPRSACFGLAPEGETGASYENLVSYFRRLSAAHGITPHSFAFRAVGPLFDKRNVRTLCLRHDAYCMNGVGKIAIAWVDALEKLTMRTDLSLRTLLPLQTLVPRYNLLHEKRRFCASCYRDDEAVGRQKYDRLLWSIQCVEACPLHKVLLERLPETTRPKRYTFWLPGISPLDGTSLANHRTNAASAEQIRSARLIAQLLDDIHRHPELFEGGSSTTKFFQHAANTLFDGQMSELAKHLGISTGQLSGWRSGTQPSLPRLANIASRCGCTISNVLLGNEVKLRTTRTSFKLRKKVGRRPRLGKFHSPERLIEELKTLDNLGKTKNLLQTARLLDVSYSCILKLAPEYAAQLVQRGREARHKEKIEGEKARFNAYWQSFQELCRENRWPTGRRVAMRLFQRTGKKINIFEACTFHARAMRLAKLSSAKPR